MPKTVLITGASGKIGRNAAQSFGAAGWRVKRFQRGTDMTAMAQGVDVIVNGMNPPNYKNWAKNIPDITRQHIAAAKASGARVILPGNVYNYGRDLSGVWDAATPQQAKTRKGKLRIEAEAAYRTAGVRCLVLRAENFIDPDGDDDPFSMIHLMRLKKGIFTLPGRAEARQAWCYLPDWAAAAVQLAELDAEPFMDVPFAGHTLTGAQMHTAVERFVGPLRTGKFPWGAIRLASPFWGMAREMLEMQYLWDLDHSLASARLNELLPDLKQTPIDTVMRRKLIQHLGREVEVNPNQAVA